MIQAAVSWKSAALAGYGIGARLEYLLIPLSFGVFPDLWTQWFAADPQHPARVAANLYLRIVGAFYGPFGFGLAFFFASQGAGRLYWPLAGSFARLGLAVIGGVIAVAGSSLPVLYGVIGLSFLVYALVPGVAFKRASWSDEDARRRAG